jgi:hypothetical protein
LHQRFSVFHENSVDLPKKISACGEHWTPAARPRYAPAPLKKLRLQVSWRPLTLAGPKTKNKQQSTPKKGDDTIQ